MRVVHAVYEQGKVEFSFDFPETHGPVAVLVIFPDYEEPFEPHGWDEEEFEEWEWSPDEIPP